MTSTTSPRASTGVHVQRHALWVLCTGLALTMSACGGSGGDDAPAPTPTPTPAPAAIDLAQRTAAASATAQSASNACAPIQPFFWEVGDASGRLASGSVQAGGGAPIYTGATVMSIASASKWLYGGYVTQMRGGQLSDEDVKYLTFQSGHTGFRTCLPGQTVDGCLALGTNGAYDAASDGKFAYGGGHMQKHASLMGLGALDNAGLATEMRRQLGTDIAMIYVQPQPAGGVVSSADAYGVFLRKVLAGQLKMKDALGTHAVCTNPATCASAVNTPVPASVSYHYSIGHWVEDDPATGDGALSSAGAFGFYPWIDASKTWYGIVARKDTSAIGDAGNPDAAGHGFASQQCGRLIRTAWISGVAQ